MSHSRRWIRRVRARIPLAATRSTGAARFSASLAKESEGEARVTDLPPVRGGPVVVGSKLGPMKPGEPVSVTSFWIDPAAVSISEFQAFLADVKNRRDAVQLALGGHHTCARRTDGTVACWGDNIAGQSTPPPGFNQ
jgi:formylglycine-generating enzyme required for sulfatase activity